MMLTPAEQAFVEKRRTMLALWPYAGGGMLTGMFGFAAWLWIFAPAMINPMITVEAIQSGALEETTLYVMAVLLPILMLALLGGFVVVVALFFVAFNNERKLIAILDRGGRT